MTTLSTMRARIASDLQITGSEYNSQIDDAIRSALRMYRKRRFEFLKKTGTVTLSSGNSVVTLPSDYSAHGTFRILVNGTYRSHGDGFDQISFDDLNDCYRSNLTSGTPSRCAVLKDTLYVDANASDDFTVGTTYFCQDAALPTADGDTSVWFDDGWDAIRSRAFAIFKDESLEYQSAPSDWQRADRYYSELIKANNYGA